MRTSQKNERPAYLDGRPLRILCISPLFAPAANAEAFCATKIVQALEDRGVSVTVLSSSNLYPSLRTDASKIWNSVREIAVDIPQVPRRNALHSITAAIQFQTLFYARWVNKVVATATTLHRLNTFDLVYSRSLPMNAHLAGFWCAKKLGLPWIVNINDPWDFCLYSVSEQGQVSAIEMHAYKFWLKRTLTTADIVTYPCKGLYRFHADLAQFEHTAEIIPHIGYKSTDGRQNEPADFRLVHAGMLGSADKTGRSARALLEGFKAFIAEAPDRAKNAKLVLVGPVDEEIRFSMYALGLAGNVEIVGKVSYEESLTYISSASACVLIEADMPESIFFPSKLADYIVAGKPVLALSPRVGLVADLASRGELIRVGHDASAVRDALASLYTGYSRNMLQSCAPSMRLQTEFDARMVAENLLSLCDRVLFRNRVGRAAGPPAYVRESQHEERL